MMHSLQMEDQIQLAHILKALVQCLHEHLDKVQDAQLTLRRVYTEHEIESSVVAVHDFPLFVCDKGSAVKEVAERVVTSRYQMEGFSNYLLLLSTREVFKEFYKTRLTEIVENDYRFDHFTGEVEFLAGIEKLLTP